MKPIFLSFALSMLLLHAQEPGASSPHITAEESPDFQVLSSTTNRELHVEPAPLPDMTPVAKMVDVTVELVADPQLPVAKTPPPTAFRPLTEEQRAQWLAERKKFIAIQLSATVYDGKWSYLRWYPHGNRAPAMTAWSNIDFNVFFGMDRFTHDNHEFTLLLLGVENVDTEKRRLAAARLGRTFIKPIIPAELQVATPTFFVIEGDASDAVAMLPLAAIHAHYAEYREQIHNDHAARLLACAEREAFLRANPPVPQDILIRVWENQGNAGTAAATPPITPLPENPVNP